MRFAIKYRRIDPEVVHPSQILATDIEGQRLAGKLVRSLAGVFEEHGCDLPPMTHWFRSRNGLHLIWAQPQ
ncbi:MULTISPECIES: hypothetical protein [Methylorubrum]|uniref:Transposase n=1 Tax=Methylorubrum suomiense TaxID=144191 RepID=A0ABQ4V2Z1_9HYPH|nr:MULTISPECIES: hypothetical protein [Methylobacteriaceae]GJE77964.1 hypothetical protein BGCPKDLD_4574 [Methylorubrum suomiense]